MAIERLGQRVRVALAIARRLHVAARERSQRRPGIVEPLQPHQRERAVPARLDREATVRMLGEIVIPRRQRRGGVAGLLDVGDRARTVSISKDLIAAALADATRQLEENIDRMKTEAGDAPLIAVGGGAFLVPEKLAGVSQIVTPR